MDFLVDLRPLLKMAFRASWLTSTLTPSWVTEKLKATAAWASAMLTKAEEEAQNNEVLSTEKKIITTCTCTHIIYCMYHVIITLNTNYSLLSTKNNYIHMYHIHT